MFDFITPDNWRFEQAWGLSLMLIILSIFVGKKSHWVAGLAFLYAGLSAIWVFQSPFATYGVAQDKMDVVSGRAFAALCMVPLGVLALTPRGIKNAWRVLEVVVIIESLCTMWFGNGLFHANSADAAFLVMAVPPLYFRPDRAGYERATGNPSWAVFLLALPVLALFWTPGSTHFFAAVGAIGGYYIASRNFKWWVPAVLIVAALLWGYNINGTEFLSSNGRSAHWKLFLDWWWANADHLIGTGAGTFEWLGYGIQSVQAGHKVDRDIFIWMHNDYLQILFEQGTLGIAFFGSLWAVCIWKARRTPWIMSTLGAASVVMITQFPLRFFVTQILLALIVVEALKCERLE